MTTLAEIDRLDALVNANPDDAALLRRWNETVVAYERETGDTLLWCDDCGARLPATAAADARGYYHCAACAGVTEEA